MLKSVLQKPNSGPEFLLATGGGRVRFAIRWAYNHSYMHTAVNGGLIPAISIASRSLHRLGEKSRCTSIAGAFPHSAQPAEREIAIRLNHIHAEEQHCYMRAVGMGGA